MYQKITHCRICGNKDLVSIFNLGEQHLTGVFPKSKIEKISFGPLELIKCNDSETKEACGLVQLRHSFSDNEMYGENYGYRSGLNISMVQHLQSITSSIRNIIQIKKGDIIVDIGSNDATLLKSYPLIEGQILIGMDPTGLKFKKFYADNIHLIPDFFSAKNFFRYTQGKKAKIISSISMFYDLENPKHFMQEIYDVLDDNGIWVFEQSYLPYMLQTNSYDTICHEHKEYYGLKQIKWMSDRVGLKIIDINFNDVNGGSFRITATKKNSTLNQNDKELYACLKKESELKLDTLIPYKKFSENIIKHKHKLLEIIHSINSKGKKIFGYGASTKGNVILQFCGLTEKDIPFIAEVNEDKFGSYTPATHIPIISEMEARQLKPDYFLVLPWHFKKSILEKEQEYIASGRKFIFPLPEIEII